MRNDTIKRAMSHTVHVCRHATLSSALSSSFERLKEMVAENVNRGGHLR